MNLTTCQICGRNIKTVRGAIALHGYRRPGQGWQTSSCPGARWQPYEVACDALRPAIITTQGGLTRVQGLLAGAPPETLVRPGVTRFAMIQVQRPEGFDPANPGYDVNVRGSYAQLFVNWRANLVREEADMRATIAYLEQRLSAWRAPAAREVGA